MQTYYELLHSELFRRLAPSIKLEEYGRDGGPFRVRRRIELRTKELDPQVLREALHTQCQCVRCRAPIHPFRPRLKGVGDRVELARHVYVAVACPLDVNVGCSRGKQSRDAYVQTQRVVEALQSRPLLPLPQGWRWEHVAGDGWAATDSSTTVSVLNGQLRIRAFGACDGPLHLAVSGLEVSLGAPLAVVAAVVDHHEGAF